MVKLFFLGMGIGLIIVGLVLLIVWQIYKKK